MAENSGAKVQQNTVPQELQDQMDKVITDAGLPVNDENRQKAQWLVGAGLPLTTDTLQQLAELDTIDYPVSEDAFAQAAASALAEGKSPVHANLARQEIYTRKPQKWYRTGSRMQNGMSRRRIWRPENNWKRSGCA